MLPPRPEPLARLLQLLFVETLAFPAERLRAADRAQEVLPALVELRPIHLEEARLGPGAAAELRAVGRALHRELEAGLVHEQLREAIAEDGVRDATAFVTEILAGNVCDVGFSGSLPASEDARDHLAFVAEQRLGHGPALVHLEDDVLFRDTHAVEKSLAKWRGAADEQDGPDRDSRRVEVDEQKRDALLLFRGRVGPDEEEHPIGLVAVARPRLLSGDHVVVSFVDSSALQGGEIAAGVRFGVTLAPADLSPSNARQVLPLLLLGAVLKQGRPDHREPEAAERRRKLAASDLHFEDRGLLPGQCCAAILARPRGRRVAALDRSAKPRVELRCALLLLAVPKRKKQDLPDGREATVARRGRAR